MELSQIKIKNYLSYLRLGQLLLVVYVLLFHPILDAKPQIFLPFIPFLDHFRSFDLLENLLYITFVISILCVLLNFHSQFFIALLGFGILLVVFADRTKFSNSLCYTASLMILSGLYQNKIHWIFRIQIGLLYFGAGLNKLLDSDWLNGQYFENFALHIFHIPLYKNLATLLPTMYLSKVLSWAIIAFELLFAMAFLFKIKILEAVFIAYLFHGSLLLMTKGQLSVLFFYLMGTSFLLSIEYPKEIIKVNYPKKFNYLYILLK